jgi:hypothetical protein
MGSFWAIAASIWAFVSLSFLTVYRLILVGLSPLFALLHFIFLPVTTLVSFFAKVFLLSINYFRRLEIFEVRSSVTPCIQCANDETENCMYSGNRYLL